MAATSTALHASTLQRVAGRGAGARPRQAVAAAAAVLLIATAALLVLVKPWNGGETSSATAAAKLTKTLSRHAAGPGGTDVSVIWATPQYLELTNQGDTFARYDADDKRLFVMGEAKHDGDLPSVPRPLLREGGMDMPPTRAISTVSASHHRLTLFVFPKMTGHGAHAAHEQARVQFVLPPAGRGGKPSVLSWVTAAGTAEATAPAPLHLTWATLLALFGGLLSSMWPCLFQLTVYFVPTLAGLSTTESSGARARARVVKTAAAFVLGFVVVYTAAGAAAGFAAQSLDGTSVFWSFRRPMSIVAGVVILLMAIRLAANGRAPLVCKMPLGNFLGRRRVGYLGTMVLGLAFAVGCTTCFGAAIVLGMVAYVGVAGTPLSGALIMLVFSLGMAIPLMAGAAAMAHVVGHLGRLEKFAPYMALGASVIMAGFAALLLSGHYMTLSNLVAGGAGQ